MAKHKYIDRICLAAALGALLLSLLLMNGQALGIQSAARVMGYETRLFDTSRVHTIDIVMDDWDAFIDGCEDEEYVSCAVVIDNESYKNVGIRAKGNTSLTTVAQMGSDRYSFKMEFDHYESGRTYYGLDKLSLNNIIQDNTSMKDYLTYQMMAAFGASAPLCSYVYITVNGQDWGLYLAVEGVEDGFLQRNYGQDHGELYKPDSMSFGGGRGNGRAFDMEDFADGDGAQDAVRPGDGADMGAPGGQGFGGERPEQPGEIPAAGGESAQPAGGQFPNGGQLPDAGQLPGGGAPNGGGMDFGGMGSSDVKLQYIDDDPDSYANIFDNAKTDVTQGDKARLIEALKKLSEGGDAAEAVDVDQVLRYFVVHNFVVNGDSYTGSMVHNYYLYEKDGLLSMIPWDYNLAFGTFQAADAATAVNDPIDTPLSVTGSGDRPMMDWILASEEYTQLYHQYFEEFLQTVDVGGLIDHAYALIASYVEKDPTKFCTMQEFEAGVSALKAFCALRTESVSGQLAGSIPSTSDGQSAQREALVDASALTLSDMGTMDNGGRGGFSGREGGQPFAQDGLLDQDGNAQPAFGADAPQPSESAQAEEADRQFSGEGRRPEGMGPGGASGSAPGGAEVQSAGTGPVLLAVSVLGLLAGLAVAFKFRR